MEPEQEIIADFVSSFEATLKSSIEEAISATKKKVVEEKKQQFDDYGANDWDDTKFPSIQKSTVKRKKKYDYPDKPLYRTGDLKNSLYSSSSEDEIDVESHDAEHALYAADWLRKKGSKHSFLALSDKEEDAAMDFLVDQLAKSIKNAFE